MPAMCGNTPTDRNYFPYVDADGNAVDTPRFGYRAVMLDATRYFIPKDEVLKIIDLMADLRLNKLHLHLSDDNGWRLEIKKYPKLTEVGAWRVDRPEIFPGRMNQQSADEPTPVGGFYTQDEMREIVAFAAERGIEVIPEIEMPAHSAAAIAAYPELACPVVDKFVGVFPGIGGPDASIIMCAGNDSVFSFYRDVLDEVMEIFPSKYIHLGGDEANKSVWEQCPLCNARKEAEHLHDFEELQGYFMDRMSRYVHEKGRIPMGWDEVTLGNPKEDMIILGWQGNGGAAVRDARKTGRKFVLTPAKTLYLLRYQGPQWMEPYTYFGNNTLKDVYMYEPVEKNWTPELKDQLLGIQASLWTEFCFSPDDMEYLLFPRLIAFADAAWRPEGSADWEGFLKRLDAYLPVLEEKGFNYSRKSMYNLQHTVTPAGNGVEVALECIRPDVDIVYTIDGEKRTYESPFKVDKPVTLTAVTSKEGKEKGEPLNLSIGFNKATGKTVTANGCRNDLPQVLTNGVRGSERQSDFEWAGWHDADAEFVVDLGEVQPVKGVKLGTLGFSHTCVAMPESVNVYGSTDGENYTLMATSVTPEELVFHKEPLRHDIDFGDMDGKVRYLKVVAKNPGKVPAGYAREGALTWLYFDELTVL